MPAERSPPLAASLAVEREECAKGTKEWAPAGKEKEWAELSVVESAAAVALGYTEAMWADGVSPEACLKRWGELTAVQLSAAAALGYTEAEWEAELQADLAATADAAALGAASSPADPQAPCMLSSSRKSARRRA